MADHSVAVTIRVPAGAGHKKANGSSYENHKDYRCDIFDSWYFSDGIIAFSSGILFPVVYNGSVSAQNDRKTDRYDGENSNS